MSHIPYRTGLPSLHKVVLVVCGLLNRYIDIIKAVLPEPQHVYVDALQQACDDFRQNVGNPRPGDE